MSKHVIGHIGNQPIEVQVSGSKKVHDKGAKGERDRAVILHSYQAMCEEFKVPKDRRLSPRDIATMTTSQLYQASKDLYNGTSIKNAARLARKLGVSKAPTLWEKIGDTWCALLNLLWDHRHSFKVRAAQAHAAAQARSK